MQRLSNKEPHTCQEWASATTMLDTTEGSRALDTLDKLSTAQAAQALLANMVPTQIREAACTILDQAGPNPTEQAQPTDSNRG